VPAFLVIGPFLRVIMLNDILLFLFFFSHCIRASNKTTYLNFNMFDNKIDENVRICRESFQSESESTKQINKQTH